MIRYSYQRQFSEVYDYARADKKAKFAVCDPCLEYIPRGVDLLDLDEKPAKRVGVGSYTLKDAMNYTLRRFMVAPMTPEEDQWAPEELEVIPFFEYLRMVPDYSAACVRGTAGTVEHWDLGKIETGFLTLRVKAKTDCRIIAAFAEQNAADGRPNAVPSDATNCVTWSLPAGEYNLISLEPYTVMGVEIMVTDGEVDVEYVGVTECAY